MKNVGSPAPGKLSTERILMKMSILNITLQMLCPGFLLERTSGRLLPSADVFCGAVRPPADTNLPIIPKKACSIVPKILRVRTEHWPHPLFCCRAGLGC